MRSIFCTAGVGIYYTVSSSSSSRERCVTACTWWRTKPSSRSVFQSLQQGLVLVIRTGCALLPSAAVDARWVGSRSSAPAYNKEKNIGPNEILSSRNLLRQRMGSWLQCYDLLGVLSALPIGWSVVFQTNLDALYSILWSRINNENEGTKNKLE